MTQLVYLSPVPWSSFSQRPHKFVAWFHESTDRDVLWLDPYLTRFPVLADLRYLKQLRGDEQPFRPPWMTVIEPCALPIEPMPGSRWANALLWKRALHVLDVFSSQRPTLLVIGKPSVLALAALERLKHCRSVYDAMDDFPNFYSGLSRLAVRKREQKIVRLVAAMLVSSTALKQRWREFRPDVQLVHNGIDASVLPAPKTASTARDTKVLGYMGTVGAWFDWDWVIALAKARPMDEVRLIGPVFTKVPSALPDNIKTLQPLDHRAAMKAMRDFDVGLIPFKKNKLTVSVDPIKYYEYRSLGLPVISTDFGEMTLRRGAEATFLSMNHQDIPNVVETALRYETNLESVRQFKEDNTWERRFGGAKII